MDQLIDAGILIPIVAIAGTFSWLIIATLAGCCKSMFSTWRHTRLKERMLERGFTAYEIERIMAAGKGKARSKSGKKGVNPVSAEAYDMPLSQKSYS